MDTLVAAISLRRPGYLAAGDVYPGYFMPGNHVLEHSLAMWGNNFSALGSPQYAPLSSAFSLFGDLGLRAGLSGPTIQWLFYCAMLLAQGLGAVWFARVLFPERRFVALVAGLAYPLSFYNAQSFNPVQAFAMGYIPLVAAFLMSRLRAPVNPIRFGIEIGFLSLGFMILVATPPMGVFAAVWALLWTVVASVRWRALAQTWLGLALGLVLGIAVNAWWAYAAAVTLFASGGAAEQTFANPFEWAFVHSNASVWNLLSMQGSWAYPLPEYYPWAVPYMHGILRFALYVPALLALVGILLAPYRRRVWLLVAIIVVCLFFAKGTHAPLGSLNAFLYANLPLFWLLRDPQFELDIALYLCLFVLAGVGASQLLSVAIHRYHRRTGARGLRFAACTAAAGLIGLTIVNGLPLIHGDLIPETWLLGAAKPIVTLPAYWGEAARFLNMRPDDSRVLLLPNDDFYAMGYSWGFYGADVVAAGMLKRPVVVLAPEPLGYVSGSKALRTELHYLQDAIQTQSRTPIAPMLSSLGIGWIVQRNDIVSTLPGRTIIPPSEVARYLARQPGIKKIARFGQLDVYHVESSPQFVAAYDGLGIWLSGAIPDLAVALSLTKSEVPWLLHEPAGLSENAVAVRGFIKYGNPSGSTTTVVKWPGDVSLSPRTISVRLVETSPVRVVLDLAGPTLMNGGRSSRWRRTLSLPLSAPLRSRFVLEVGAQHFVVESAILKVPVDVGTYTASEHDPRVRVRVWVDRGRDLFAGQAWSQVADCWHPDSASLEITRAGSANQEDARLHVSVERHGGARLSARAHAACVHIDSRHAIARGEAILSEIAYRTVQGAPPRIEAAFGNSTVVPSVLPARADWMQWSAWNPAHKAGRLKLWVYAYGGPHGSTTVTAYRAPAAWPMVRAAEVSIVLDEQRATTEAGTIALRTPRSSPNLLHDANFSRGLWSALFNAHLVENLTDSQAGLAGGILPGGVLDLSARKDGLGECQRISGVAGRLLRVSFEARTEYGPTALLRLLDKDDLPFFESRWARPSSRWEQRSADVVVPPASDAIALCLYAFADPSPTKVQYRNMRITAWPGGIGDALWVGGGSPDALPVASTTGDGTRYDINIPAGAKVVVVRTSYTPAWILELNRKPLNWPHVPIDGYLNGWLVPDGGAHHVVAVYKPAKTYKLLQAVAVATLIVMTPGLFGFVIAARHAKTRRTRARGLASTSLAAGAR